jgi:trehalose transport system substrate-binding protein
METPNIPTKPKGHGVLIAVIAVVVVIILVGSFIGLDYNNLFHPKPAAQTIFVYSGPAGPANADHLLGGCVVAEMANGSTPMASAQLIAFLLNPAVQKSFGSATGFIPVDTGAFNTTPSTTIPTIYKASNASVTVYYYTSLTESDYNYVSSEMSTFMSMYPNIVVKTSFISASKIVSEFQTQLAAKSHENIVTTIDNIDVGTLFFDGYLANLTSMAPTITAGAGTISSVTGLNNYEVKVFHGIYFMTQLVNIPLVWINYTAMQKAGISSPPTTDAQLMSDAKTLYNYYGVGMVNFQGHGGASTPTELYQWMVQFGGNPMVFNDTGDIAAMEYLYNLSAYFSPDYPASYWDTYTGLASNTYTIMDYQWPGSVNLTTLAMKPYNSSDTVLNASFNALSTGVFIRDPVAWLSQWQFYMDAAWTSIIEDHGSYSQIPHILSSENAALFNYLNTTSAYGPEVAMNYTMGYYQPVVT